MAETRPTYQTKHEDLNETKETAYSNSTSDMTSSIQKSMKTRDSELSETVRW